MGFCGENSEMGGLDKNEHFEDVFLLSLLIFLFFYLINIFSWGPVNPKCSVSTKFNLIASLCVLALFLYSFDHYNQKGPSMINE